MNHPSKPQRRPFSPAQAPPEESAAVLEEMSVPPAASGFALTLTRNAALNIGRLLVTTLVALVLPSYLAHRLPVKTYSAWVLILQMSAYVSYLDFGVQTGVAKYVAEFHARNDARGADARASAGLAMMLCASVLGVLMTLGLAWRVPQLFREMPANLHRDVRLSLLWVGISLSFGLLCSVFSAIFTGLQRYRLPVLIAVLNRLLFTVTVCIAVSRHSSLAWMGAAVALINILTGLLQVWAWRRMAARIRVSLRNLDYAALRQMVRYCGVLAIWSAGMLCVSGLDVTLVGRYDYGQTAFYSIATLPTNFILSILGAALGPLMPSASALSTQRTPLEMGLLLSRATRYSTLLLLLSGLPLVVGSYPVLRLWIGPNYAAASMQYLRILMVATILRNLCAPYATMLVALESQRIAVVGAVAEAVVNLGSSLYLVQHMGAIGVAYGTLLGSLVSVFFHFAINMRKTYSKLSIGAAPLFWTGLLRPGAIALPSLLLLPLWRHPGPPAISAAVWLLWGAGTLLTGWYTGLEGEERLRLRAGLTRLLLKPAAS